jgi:hypothetical protein
MDFDEEEYATLLAMKEHGELINREDLFRFHLLQKLKSKMPRTQSIPGEAKRRAAKRWRQKYPDKVRANAARHYAAHPELQKAANARWRTKKKNRKVRFVFHK